jgi:hypothetical protein
MVIENVRLGFATNSSSSHSIVIMDGNVGSDCWDDDEFGWNNFTLADPDLKLSYLAVTMYQILREQLPSDVARLCIKEWIGVEPSEDGYVDHQSQINLPVRFSHDVLDPEFVKDFAEFLKRDDIVILGGNDNGEDHPSKRLGKDPEIGIPVDSAWYPVCRKEGPGHWTLFNRETGARFTVNFNTGTRTKDPIMPMLVDMKITDQCNHGCEFCYQDSRPNGKHAEKYYDVIKSLAELRVFEVAIGGGEPTTAPEFLSILKHCRESGIVPNFSTRSLDWLREPSQWTKIIPLVGGFAVSCQTSEEADMAISLVKANGIPMRKLSIQYVMGVNYWPYSFEQMLHLCAQSYCKLTLLGYKSVGRGARYREIARADYDGWLDVVAKARKEYRCPRLGIDTALAAEFQPELDKHGISRELYRTTEDFSMYIDLVERKIGPSSYCDPSEMLDMHGEDQRRRGWFYSTPEELTELIYKIRAKG